MRALIAGVIAGLLLFAGTVQAERYQAGSTEQIEAQYFLLKELRAQGALTEADFLRERERLRHQAKARFNLDLDAARLEQLSQTQRLDWFSTALVLAGIIIGLIVAIPLLKLSYKQLRRLLRRFWRGLRPFLHKVFRPIWWALHALLQVILPPLAGFFRALHRLMRSALERLLRRLRAINRRMLRWLAGLPLWVWEVLFYPPVAAGVVLTPNRFIAIALALLFVPMLVASTFIHARNGLWPWGIKRISRYLSWIWIATALIRLDAIIGFMAVGVASLYMAFRFYRAFRMRGYGLERGLQALVVKYTAVSFAVLCVAWFVFYSGFLSEGHALVVFATPFQVGITLFMGVAFYVGLFTLSGLWFRRSSFYRIANLCTLIGGMGVIVIAFAYSMLGLFWIGCIVMLLWFGGKFYEIVYRKLDYVYTGAIVSAVLGFGGYWIKLNMPAIVDFLSPVIP